MAKWSGSSPLSGYKLDFFMVVLCSNPRLRFVNTSCQLEILTSFSSVCLKYFFDIHGPQDSGFNSDREKINLLYFFSFIMIYCFRGFLSRSEWKGSKGRESFE